MRKLSTYLCCALFVLLVTSSAFALPSEWGVVDPTDIVATDTEMMAVMTSYWETSGTQPAYFIWTEDESRMTWTLAWTGGGTNPDDMLHGGTDFFNGNIVLQNASTNDFLEIAWDSNDTIAFENTGWGGTVAYYAFAWNHFDGITFTIEDYVSPSYVGFDLFINGGDADANYIFVGSSMESMASLGEDQDFAVAAPVPEPATMLLLGSGLAGLAAVRRRKVKKA